MALDPQIQDLLDFIASRNVPAFYEVSPVEARENMMKARPLLNGEPVELPRVEDRTVPGPGGDIPVRIYAATKGGAPLPVLVYYHGGGWVIGSIESHDDLCRRLAKDSGCLVVSVDYRLAPEHKFPAAVEDSKAALHWVTEHAGELGGDARRLAVGGDSAGGNLAAVMTQVARDEGGPAIAYQLLLYPATMWEMETESSRVNGEGYFLTTEGMTWFWNHYLNNPEEGQNPLVSPMLASSLAGLPPALVITAGYDPLRDDGETYGRMLQEAGVRTTVTRKDELIHGFMSMSVVDRSREVIAEAAAILRAELAGE